MPQSRVSDDDREHGHVGYVLAALFSVDGKRLYSASVDGRVHVWDVGSGDLLERWACHEGPINVLRRSRDGSQLFTASHDGTVGVWDSADGSLIHRLTGHRGGVMSLAIATRLAASGGYDGTIRIWAVETGELIATLSAHTAAVTALAFLTSDRLASGSRDKNIHLWDVKSGHRLRVLSGHQNWVTGLAALPDGRRAISVGEDGICNLWDCERGEIIWSRRVGAGQPIWSFALAPNGERAITGGAGPTTRWDISSGVSKTIDLGASSAGRRSSLAHAGFADRSADISLDGKLVAGGGGDGSLVIFELDGDRVVRTIPGASLGYLSAAIVDEGVCMAMGRTDGSLLLQMADGRRRTVGDAHTFMAYALCRVGLHGLASGGFDSSVCVWDLPEGKLRARLDHGGLVFSVASSADGCRLVSAGADAICLWDLASKRPITRIEGVSGMHTVADLAGDGSFVSAGEDDVLRCWQPGGSLLASIPLPCDQISAMSLLPHGRRVVLAGADGAIRLIDLGTGAVENLHAAHEDWIRGVHVTPDGRYIVSASQNCICRIYDLKERQLLTFKVLRLPIPAATVGPRGEIVAVSARGEILRIELARTET